MSFKVLNNSTISTNSILLYNQLFAEKILLKIAESPILEEIQPEYAEVPANN